MHTDLERAIARDELEMLYQPQMNADGRSMASVEALVRWNLAGHGPVSPDEFVRVAEKAGLIDALGAWVMRKACLDAADWPKIGVAVNVSPLQFKRPNFVDFVLETATAAGLPHNRLEIEITENAYFHDIDHAEVALKRLRAQGVRVALDDFGTGYSSLSYLRRLPLDKIKIDKSFTDEVGKLDAAAIVQAVVALARALGLKVTAEGVETVEQQRFLRATGCHYLQGYLFSKPVPAAEITKMLALEAVPRV